MKKPIKAVFIFEMLGKPPEYLTEMLDDHIKKIGENKGLKILSKKIHDPKPVNSEKDENSGLFCSFAEVEFELETMQLLFATVVHTLPSHVEVIEPEEFNLNNFEISETLSDLAIKLHKYDEIAKILTLDNTKLANKLKEIMAKRIKIEENIPKKDKEK